MECMSFSRLFMAVSLIFIYVIQKLFGLAHQVPQLTNLKPVDNEFDVANLAFETQLHFIDSDEFKTDKLFSATVQLILAAGMVIMILVAILTAHLEAMLYLKSQHSTPNSSSSNNQQSNSHSGGNSNTGGQGQTAGNNNSNSNSNNNNNNNNNSTTFDRNHCSNHSNDFCGKDRSSSTGGNGCSGGGGNTTNRGWSAISASVSQASSHTLPITAQNNSNNSCNKVNARNSMMATGKAFNNSNSNNNYTQKKRKNSSSSTTTTTISTTTTATTNNNNSGSSNSEKVPLGHGKSSSSNTNDKKSSPCAPMFQNLTNVIASPPPPLPTFDAEFNSIEFKKMRGRKSAKKSHSLNGSITSGEDLSNQTLLNQQTGLVGSNQASNKSSTVSKPNGRAIAPATTNGHIRMNVINQTLNCEQNSDTQAPPIRSRAVCGEVSQVSTKASLKNAFISASMFDDDTYPINGTKVDRSQVKQVRQPTVMPIQPPSSSSVSSSSSSSSSSTPSSSSLASSSSSASPSPPSSGSSYGEYSLLGPGATFELPCLRVRSAQT